MNKVISGSLLVVVVIFISVVLGTFIGALSGWIVGLFFEKTILGILACVGIKGFSMWQVGAFLGFVGGFFKSSSSSNKSE